MSKKDYHRILSSYETDHLDFSLSKVLAPEGTPQPDRVCGQCARYHAGYCEIGVRHEGFKQPTHDVGYLWPACDNYTTENTNTQNTMEKKTPQTKVCKKCGRELPADQFNRHARSRDGLQPYCKDCQKEMAHADWQKRKNTPAAKEPAPKATPVHDLDDHALVGELRRRGYDVKCTKTVEL